jgi:hypothetical protein
MTPLRCRASRTVLRYSYFFLRTRQEPLSANIAITQVWHLHLRKNKPQKAFDILAGHTPIRPTNTTRSKFRPGLCAQIP